MDIGLIILRVVHIVAGVIWVGGALFLVLVLAPQLRKLGPTIQGPVMQATVPIFSPLFSAAAMLVIGSGAWMALKLRWGNLGAFFDFAWGWAILAGFILTVAALLVGLLISRASIERALELGGSIQGRPPTPEEGLRLGALQRRITWSTQATAVLLVGAVIAMAALRGL